VVEAVFEGMALKKTVFAELDRACRPGAILATNTWCSIWRLPASRWPSSSSRFITGARRDLRGTLASPACPSEFMPCCAPHGSVRRAESYECLSRHIHSRVRNERRAGVIAGNTAPATRPRSKACRKIGLRHESEIRRPQSQPLPSPKADEPGRASPSPPAPPKESVLCSSRN